MTYDEAITYLYGLEATRGWDLKLERVRAALELLGSPQRRYPSVLIAGTNGKGASAAIVHSVLGEAGYRVGLYTSPHLVNFTERIRIGHDELSRPRVAAGVGRLRELTEAHDLGLTFFEMATVLALDELAAARVDAAVLEVGLGGRLDATNVVDPVASAVVSIGFDHEAFLGDTLAAIAREKAGVLRAGRAAVLGPGLPGEARAALLEEADRLDARVVEADRSRPELARLALAGEHMRDNAAVALALLDALGEALPGLRVGGRAVEAGLAGVRWPGRLEVVYRRPLVVVDGAHNREGVAALVSALPAVFGGRRPRLLFAALADKPWREMAARLAPHVACAVATRVGGARGVPAGELREGFPAGLPVSVEADPVRAFVGLLADAGSPVLVAGSLYLAGAVYEVLLERYALGSIFAPFPGLAA